MGREFPATEDEFELSLELSIGGCYAKSETKSLERETTAPPGGDEGSHEVSRSDFSCEKPQIDVAAENAGEFSDLQRRREMQAMKRKEARMKRDFKKTRGANGGGGEDRAVLEAQQFHGGVERREREGIPEEEESARKREKISNAPSLLFGENKVTWGDYGPPPPPAAAAQFMLPVGNGYACPLVVPMWGSNVAAGEREERNSGEHTTENVAVAAVSSSAVSHHRSTSHKGGSSSDTGGSQSSSFGTHQSDKVEHLEVNNSSSHTEPGRGIVASSSNIQQQRQSETSKTVEGSTVRAQNNLTDTCCSTTEKPSSSHASSVVEKPPNLPTSGQDNGASAQMPCVSTTGNGPNGRTITGFLHKYTKAEVSIMCVCHGSFFSPAGFVEHAGGVNVTHPLRHITVVPSVVR